MLWLFLIAIILCEFITIISNFESNYKYDNSIKYSVRTEFSKIYFCIFELSRGDAIVRIRVNGSRKSPLRLQ